jgi:hypothetical protein
LILALASLFDEWLLNIFKKHRVLIEYEEGIEIKLLAEKELIKLRDEILLEGNPTFLFDFQLE